MKSHTDKNNKEANQAAAHVLDKQPPGVETSAELEDTRPEAVRQRKLQKIADSSAQSAHTSQLQLLLNPSAPNTIQKKENNTGLPDQLKSGIENLSGYAMDDVKVNYNSNKPAQLGAHAFAQGTEIHLGPGQEKHLHHEAWHVAQQKQGRVKPTTSVNGAPVNDDASLEREADSMGQHATAMQLKTNTSADQQSQQTSATGPRQATVAQRQPVIQRETITVTVTGITHLVQMAGKSVMEGAETIEVKDGDEIQIDTGTKVRSRRGPHQEIYKERDIGEEHLYRWFLVTKIKGKKAPANYYIRDETFITSTPEALGTRGAKIGEPHRTRMSPAQVEEHGIATNIIKAAEVAPGRGEIDRLISNYAKEAKPVHDPAKTARFMRICYALSQDPDINRLVGSGEEADFTLVKKVVDILQSTSRQIIQEWGNPVGDIEQRAVAWTAFRDGVAALSDNKAKLYRYMNSCLVHDKGYRQTYESAAEYFLYMGDIEATEEESFETILKRALNDEINTNIWVGGMAGSGKYSEQLKRLAEPDVKTMKTIPAKDQEMNMWQALLPPIMNAKFGMKEKDWSYIGTILENQNTLYAEVRRLVPTSFELHKAYIAEAFSF